MNVLSTVAGKHGSTRETSASPPQVRARAPCRRGRTVIGAVAALWLAVISTLQFAPPLAFDLFLAAGVALTSLEFLTSGRTHAPRPARWLARLGAVASAAYLLGLRPWMARWGTRGYEAHRALPGDELVPRPAWQSTRAITIYAPPEAVWPWLVQLGQGRGGFYLATNAIDTDWSTDAAPESADEEARTYPNVQGEQQGAGRIPPHRRPAAHVCGVRHW